MLCDGVPWYDSVQGCLAKWDTPIQFRCDLKVVNTGLIPLLPGQGPIRREEDDNT